MDEKLYQLALHLTPGLGSILIRQLVSHFGSAEKVFKANYNTLVRVAGIGEATARGIGQKTGLQEAEKELQQADKQGVQIVFYTDAAYPRRLKSLYDAPALLYWKGNLDFNAGRFVGIVGTRKATDYGRGIVEEIVQGLADKNTTIVSGLAYGIDIAAHRICLKHRVPNIGVMATGIDNIYPATHAKTAAEIQADGGILTENRLHTKPDAARFPARNRIIAGMSDATIIVEAAERGGALITAEYANNYNRDVFAVPGNLTNSYSIGCNNLIRDHKAQIFTGVTDLIEALRWSPTAPSDASTQLAALPEHFTQEESQVVAILRQKGDMQIDDLTWESQIQAGKLATLLLNLELQGYVRVLPGKRFALA
ncbi:MAG: DNA-protecting protein DprA [Runella slithyformis]|nr:MAG: DNA-protecting protein DprA [Runella sp.]TAG16447.1 MAG: DNA-protecting protein DprA [Cytophagales bacterium]TAG36415.1 MAG: DNA-protecting protein DprA [Cytophagia bacterium]TAG56349.1 MAG: DNA-protecting protein DprA [Runella slithyformis]TAG77475.1 MAG: DNA-protecting protein DprA [Cytophagales bacterium]